MREALWQAMEVDGEVVLPSAFGNPKYLPGPEWIAAIPSTKPVTVLEVSREQFTRPEEVPRVESFAKQLTREICSIRPK